MANRVWIVGHRGMLGRALCCNAPTGKRLICASKAELDLRRQADVEHFLEKHQPDVMMIAAGHVGGIWANANEPAPFIYDNLAIIVNLVEAARKSGVRQLIYFGSACVYPLNAMQPMTPDQLMSGCLEVTNKPYAMAKLAGTELVQTYSEQYGLDYFTLMPCNLYGPHDNFDPMRSHVIPALINKFCNAVDSGAQEVEIWGDGTAKREFLHVDDCAKAAWQLLLAQPTEKIINIGSGHETPIRSLVELIAELTQYRGEIKWLPDMPQGAPRRVLNSEIARSYGWKPTCDLPDGLKQTLDWYRDQIAAEKGTLVAQ